MGRVSDSDYRTRSNLQKPFEIVLLRLNRAFLRFCRSILMFKKAGFSGIAWSGTTEWTLQGLRTKHKKGQVDYPDLSRAGVPTNQ